MTRLFSLIVSLTCLLVLVTAARLHPSPTGTGTHEALGLRECQFKAVTGIPCPSCGMTTSFAWFVRGNLVASFYIQPMGMVLACLTCLAFWAGLYIAITGRAAYRLLAMIPGRYYVFPLLGFAILAWGWKIALCRFNIDGWH
jgi:hypothetical protein